METYDYAAFDKSGNRLTGSVVASTAREARDILRSRSLTPVDLRQVKNKEQTKSRRLGRVSHKDLTQATRQLAILIETATPVEEALKVVALQFEKSAMRGILMDVRSRVMEGTRLSDALHAHPRTFSDLYSAMVASGEASGQLAAVLDRLAMDMEAAQEVRNKVIGAVAYPIILSVVAIIVVILLMVYLVPTLVEQFDSLDQDLPPLTRFVIGLSNGVIKYGVFILIGIAGLVFASRQALKNREIQLRWSAFLLKVPFLGNLIRSINAARFARTMAGLLDSGTPALASMETALHTLRNSTMRKAVTEAAVKVREGSPISTSLRQSGTFPPLVIQMVAGGEASGDIAKMFTKSAEYLEGDFNRVTTVFLNILNPLIIILLSFVVLLVILAMYMPMLQMVAL
ncbi:MAG: type II secretion system protein GspF [Hellea sp.]|nr:type II secretion system protein GspF [Hellea sp.]